VSNGAQLTKSGYSLLETTCNAKGHNVSSISVAHIIRLHDALTNLSHHNSDILDYDTIGEWSSRAILTLTQLVVTTKNSITYTFIVMEASALI